MVDTRSVPKRYRRMILVMSRGRENLEYVNTPSVPYLFIYFIVLKSRIQYSFCFSLLHFSNLFLPPSTTKTTPVVPSGTTRLLRRDQYLTDIPLLSTVLDRLPWCTRFGDSVFTRTVQSPYLFSVPLTSSHSAPSPHRLPHSHLSRPNVPQGKRPVPFLKPKTRFALLESRTS